VPSADNSWIAPITALISNTANIAPAFGHSRNARDTKGVIHSNVDQGAEKLAGKDLCDAQHPWPRRESGPNRVSRAVASDSLRPCRELPTESNTASPGKA